MVVLSALKDSLKDFKTMGDLSQYWKWVNQVELQVEEAILRRHQTKAEKIGRKGVKYPRHYASEYYHLTR